MALHSPKQRCGSDTRVIDTQATSRLREIWTVRNGERSRWAVRECHFSQLENRVPAGFGNWRIFRLVRCQSTNEQWQSSSSKCTWSVRPRPSAQIDLAFRKATKLFRNPSPWVRYRSTAAPTSTKKPKGSSASLSWIVTAMWRTTTSTKKTSKQNATLVWSSGYRKRVISNLNGTQYWWKQDTSASHKQNKR